MDDFSNKRVLITGASRGIGFAIAKAFAEQGAKVIGIYRADIEHVQAAVKQLAGTDHQFHQLDISQPKQLKAFVDKLTNEQQNVDILVNNAGIYHELELNSATSFDDWQDNWQHTLAVNLQAPANLAFLVAQQMLATSTAGRIINISSRGAFRGEPEAMAYGASKAAINSLTQSLAVKLAPSNIAVAAVAPGFVATDMVSDLLASAKGDEIRGQSPFNRVAEPADVAAAVMYLASDAAEFASGTIIDVNGASYLRS